MKIQQFPADSATNPKLLPAPRTLSASLRATTFAVACLVVLLAAPTFAQRRLSASDILTALRSNRATPAEKDQLLTQGVRQRGVAFPLTAKLESKLRAAGASQRLLDAIRAFAPSGAKTKTGAFSAANLAPWIDNAPVATMFPPAEPETDVTYVEMNPQTVEAPQTEADLLRRKAAESFAAGDLDAAIADYGRAIELNPAEPALFFQRGVARLNKQDFAAAIADFDQAVGLAPNDAAAHSYRAGALEKLNMFDAAARDYESVLGLEPDNEKAKFALVRVRDAIARAARPLRPNIIVITNKPVEPPMKANELAAAPIGALNAYATRLSMPDYPAPLRQDKVEGIVSVEVALNEAGEVTGAKAVYGPAGLRSSAEEAVRRSTFKPVVLDGSPKKATGFINYSFKVD